VTMLLHPLESAVLGAEVQIRGPVVGKVLAEHAARARGLLRHVFGRHGGVEVVASHNLVHVRGRDLAGIDEGVQAVDDDVAAAEPQHRLALLGLDEADQGEESSPTHFR